MVQAPASERNRAVRPVMGAPARCVGVRRLPILGFLFLFLLAARSGLADPAYQGPLLYGLDPVIRATDDPRLLGLERLVLLERMKGLGVEPRRTGITRPGLESSLRSIWLEKSRVDLVRMEHLVEYHGPVGLLIEIRHPKFFFLFPAPETLPGGFQYYPPRPLGNPLVEVFVDDIEAGMARRHGVDQVSGWIESLSVVGKGRTQQSDGINLTIPIKLPRTLEKIIGRGEKTRIKISGREHISLSGESTVIKPFVGSERVQNQSLFPSLDMEQELQVNLSGTIGEKIIIEVDHNSAAIGPEATKIKLMYQGLEDEIIQTIESGDVGLTLPGSQLLGYSSNKSGLFGIKVTGQVGRADFTAVASKQKAESSSKSFNAKGGTVEDRIIYSSDYLNNRFFRLDRPEVEPGGRVQGLQVDLSSLKIYLMMGPGPLTGDDIENVAAYVDSLGYQFWNPTSMDFEDPHIYGQRWREITSYDPLLDADGGLVAIDMRTRMQDDDVLAVTYNIIDQAGAIVATVGDRPGAAPTQTLPDATGLFYRLKLLKAPVNDNHPHIFNYVLRNIYSLGGANIDPQTFSLRIERNTTTEAQPQIDEAGLDYIRIFGLDRENAQRTGGPDGVVDFHNEYLFDLNKGLLKFPLDFPAPFAADGALYAAYADTPSFAFEPGTFLYDNQAPRLYDPAVLPTEYNQYQFFRLVATHASASNNISLGVSNIEEGSESVTLDGRTLTRGTDYEIDYTFGEITLMGDNANLTPDSQISVNYQYAPFIGGGKTSLMGLNLGYDLGRESKLSTTWLYQAEAIVGEKAKLGEEPSKNLVGNVNFSNTFKPYFLTHAANFLSLKNSDRESSVQFSGELAVSVPNPNTKGRVFLEDFEGVDSSNFVSLNRTGWSWASAPYLGSGYVSREGDLRQFDPIDRVQTLRWFLPRDRVLRRYLNPELQNQERDETQQAMDLYLRAEDGIWDPEDWGGIMRGISRTGVDLSKSQFVEIWVNDGKIDLADRSGRLHIDFGFINEDGFWPKDAAGQLIVGDFEQEDGIVDGNRDGVWTYDEDIGLDGRENGSQRYSAEYEIDGDAPFPRINGTSRNNREDTEDLNGNTRLDRDNGYFTTTIDLAETEALVDVLFDYDDVQDLRELGQAWRKYRIPLGAVDSVSVGTAANIKAVTHVRIWYENDDAIAPAAVHLQLSELKFLGSRWEREGVRRSSDETLLGDVERRGAEFFLGEVNNKENPDYNPPFPVPELNNIPEKEQSLVLDFKDLQQGHMIRIGKQVSPRGDDYTPYRDLSWYLFNQDQRNADLDLFFRVGSDSLNYYEVTYRFADSQAKTGWHGLTIGLAELSNVKQGELDDAGVAHGTVVDKRTGDVYQARVVGRPDLRRVKRYYFGIRNENLSEPVSGFIYFNDVILEDVKKEIGMAQRAGVRVNMADVIKVDLDWKHTDSEYHGLDRNTGSGIDYEDWNVAANFNADDFVPMLGFRLPVNLSRRQTVQRPKYVTNSDIEIIDDDMRNVMSTIDTQERFSSRVSHSPSQGSLPRYLVDPWTFLLNGSRSRLDGPLERRRQKSLQGSLNYDLRITGKYTLASYPVLESIPLLRGLSLVPKKIAMGASFTSSWQSSATIDDRGNVLPRPEVLTRPGVLSGSIDYQPMNLLDMSVTVKSDRDLLRERQAFGVNIGEENRRSYDLRMTIVPPQAKDLPDGAVFAPLRTAARQVTKLRPSIQFTGNFADQHDPAIRQAGDSDDVRSVSNNGNWDLRFDLPIGEAVKSVLPEKKITATERSRMIEEQRRREQQSLRGSGRGRGGAATDSTGVGGPGGGDLGGLTPEERRRLEEERLLEEAQERLEEEQAQGLGATPEPAAPVEGEGGRLDPLALLNPFLNILRESTPVKVTLSDKRSSSYTRLEETAPFWYMAGLENSLDVPDTMYAARASQESRSLNLSTTTKINRNVGFDVKYGETNSLRDQVGTRSRSMKTDWPDVQFTLNGIEKWGVFGSQEDDPNSGWFRSSNLNLSYKRTKNVNNYTEVSYNPSVSTSIGPRWTFNFHSGLTATLNSTLNKDASLSNGVLTTSNKMRFGLQLRHQFRAQGLLAKLGLYRPGNNPTVNMDVDISYQRDRTERLNPGGRPAAPTGQTRYSVNPRFSYQVTRNLNGAVRFIYSHTKNVATDQSTTSLGLGVEATFVF
ncbi:MAG: cell surface protein SprA [bacterium]